jgi:hypothetical protein
MIRIDLHESNSLEGNIQKYFDKVIARSILIRLPMIAIEFTQINLQWGQKGVLLVNILPR